MRRLVISPHADDEVLGCSSILDSNTFVYYVGVDEFHVVSRDDRLREIESVSNYFGFQYDWSSANAVNNYEIQDLIPEFENLINKLKPIELFIPFYGSYNQDHRVVYQAALVAARPHDRNHFVRKVLMYELPDMLWTPEVFYAQYLVALDLRKKLEGLSLHASQVRRHRSPAVIESIARIRGEQAGIEHAEGFQVLRYFDRREE